MKERTEMNWEHFSSNIFTIKKTQSKTYRGIYKQEFTMFKNTYTVSTYKTGPHADTHTNENKPRVLYWTLAAEVRDELGVRVQLGT